MPDHKLKTVTRLEDALNKLEQITQPVERTEKIGLESADGRVLAEEIVAGRSVPHYRKAAMDGYAVRAKDTLDAERSPVTLRKTTDSVGEGEAIRVHTGSEVPDGADSVIRIEEVREPTNDKIEVTSRLTPGKDVAPVGEDVEEGKRLYGPGDELSPSDLALLRSTGLEEVEVYEQPRVSVIPTGDELVRNDPRPGQTIETNGLMVSRCVERWGGEPFYHDFVEDDPDALEKALRQALSHDIVVTTGGSSVGERDIVPEVVQELGEVQVHGVAMKPGHPVALGRIEDTPVIMLPGYPVSCVVNSVQFLRPALKRTARLPLNEPSSMRARLGEKVSSEPGVRSFVRVQVEDLDGRPVASPVRSSGASVLSGVTSSNGWLVVPENYEGLQENEVVTVELWED